MTITQIAGGENDFQLVRHLSVGGSQFDIGRAMAEEMRDRFGWAPRPADRTVTRARMAWFERHWPQHLERLDGVAATFDLDPDRDDLCLDGLSVLPFGSGCSALWCPPSASTDGHGRIARNYDFFTATSSEIMGGAPLPGELPMASRPYVITTTPEDGLASTVITMNDLDGAMDGVNEAGPRRRAADRGRRRRGAPVVVRAAGGPELGPAAQVRPRHLRERGAGQAGAAAGQAL
ncbi:hypothetical protein [Nonomuraea dietziae]|uniref:hypothetical protein n=1 Tax=Nonomuraea dietziae TaxID=65515 RepID=UPI0031D993AA